MSGRSGFNGVVRKPSGYTPEVWQRVTADANAANGDLIVVDSASSVSITAPGGPSEGHEFSVARYGAGAVTIPRNGSTIADLAEDLTISERGQAVRLVYLNGTWRVFLIGLVA